MFLVWVKLVLKNALQNTETMGNYTYIILDNKLMKYHSLQWDTLQKLIKAPFCVINYVQVGSVHLGEVDPLLSVGKFLLLFGKLLKELHLLN